MCENLYDVRYIPETKTIKEMQVSKILNMKNCTGKPRVFSNVPGVRCLNNSCNIDEVVPTLFSLSVYVCLSFCLSVCLSVSLLVHVNLVCEDFFPYRPFSLSFIISRPLRFRFNPN